MSLMLFRLAYGSSVVKDILTPVSDRRVLQRQLNLPQRGSGAPDDPETPVPLVPRWPGNAAPDRMFRLGNGGQV
jgi:hypothetical protein